MTNNPYMLHIHIYISPYLVKQVSFTLYFDGIEHPPFPSKPIVYVIVCKLKTPSINMKVLSAEHFHAYKQKHFTPSTRVSIQPDHMF